MISISEIARDSQASQDKFELCEVLKTLNSDGRLISRILEIGVHKGWSVANWQKAFPHATIVGIELDPQYLEFTQFRLIKGDSNSLHIRDIAADQGPYDFIFIDGDHRYEQAKRDWELYQPLARKGGVIAMHDTQRLGKEWYGKVETARLFAEIRRTTYWHTTEFHGGKDAPGTGLVFV